MPDYGHFVALTSKDLQRLSPHYRKTHVVDTGYGPALATKERQSGLIVCVAFRGQPGKRCRCAIYDSRPMMCRRFRPGGMDCIESRMMLFDDD